MERKEIVLLVLIIILIVSFMMISYFWDDAITSEYKADTVIPSYPVTLRNANPPRALLTSNEKDKNQPTGGYRGPTLRQPCIPASQLDGLANLPNSYVTSDCGIGAECTDTLYKGKICLSKIGYSCISKSDCVQEASGCINNICVSDTNKLNSICINDDDCQSKSGPNNLSCVKTRAGVKRCKINNYPFGFGCNSYLDCADGNDYNTVQCLANIKENNSYDLPSIYVYGDGLRIVPELDKFNNIIDYMENKIVLIIDYYKKKKLLYYNKF